MPTVVIELWAILCALFDLRKREVPNWLTLPVLVGAIGWRLLEPDANAFLLAFITLAFWLLGWLSGGDAKGLMALGLLDPCLYAWAWVGAGMVGAVWWIVKRERRFPGFLGFVVGVGIAWLSADLA